MLAHLKRAAIVVAKMFLFYHCSLINRATDNRRGSCLWQSIVMHVFEVFSFEDSNLYFEWNKFLSHSASETSWLGC